MKKYSFLMAMLCSMLIVQAMPISIAPSYAEVELSSISSIDLNQFIVEGSQTLVAIDAQGNSVNISFTVGRITGGSPAELILQTNDDLTGLTFGSSEKINFTDSAIDQMVRYDFIIEDVIIH